MGGQGAETHHRNKWDGHDLLYYCKHFGGFKNAENMLLKMQNVQNDKKAQLVLLSYLRQAYFKQAIAWMDAGVETVVDEYGDNALHALCCCGKIGGMDLLKQILKSCPQYLNAQNKEGSTPVMICAEYARYDLNEKRKQAREQIILFLLEQGAEIHHKCGSLDLLHYCKSLGLKNVEIMILKMQKVDDDEKSQK